MNRHLAVLVSLTACLLLIGCDRDDEWPSRPITLICPWSAGGGTDRVSRQIAVQLESQLDVPVNVVNATGGGGVTGHTRGAMARPDGYTLMMATVELNMLHWRGLCPITPESYRPLAKLNEDSAAIFVRGDADWQSIVDLEDAFREAANPIPVSGSAAGSIWHLALVGWLMNREVPVDAANWISINGSAPSLQELMAGGVEVVCCSIPEAGALLKAGEVRCLGVMSDEPCPAAPEIPTFRQQGVAWSMGGWRGLAYPLEVPQARVEKMEAAIMKVAHSDEFAAFMEGAGFNISVTDGTEFANFLAEADKGFGDILTKPEMQDRQAAPLSPWFLPIGLAVLGGLLGVVGFASTRIRSPQDQATEPQVAESQAVGGGRLLLGYAGAIALFIVTCQTTGYVIAAAVVMAALLGMMRVRIPVATAIVLLVVPGLYQVFAGLLGVPLPWGWLGW